jgi:hypothetical protein
MTIDADGAPRAYHPDGSPPGLDRLTSAGHPGNWWALVSDAHGNPVVQKAGDPAEGFYISTTALEDPSRPRRDPRRYVDASTIPFVVIPPRLKRAGAALGNFATVRNKRNDKIVQAIVADIGPDDELGEGSMALARAAGIPHSPKTGGQSGDVVYVIYAGSGNGKPRTKAEIETRGAALLENWGGADRLVRL